MRTPDALKQTIAAELASGAEADAVLGFLDRHKIEHSPYQTDTRQIAGIVRDVGGTGLVKRSVTVTFHFDAARRMERYEVADAYTGP